MSTPARTAGPGLYTAELLATFAAGSHAEYLTGRRPLRPRLARALALANLRPGLELVDIGVGRGEAATHAARRGARVTGLDFSPSGVAMARDTARQRLVDGNGQVRLLAANAEALPLATTSVDRVLLLDVIEHLSRQQAALALDEIRRILRPGGYVVIHTLPNRWALALCYPALRLVVPDLPVRPRSEYEQAVHVNEQDPLTLIRLLKAAGLVARVWPEEWTTRQARWGQGLRYPDAARVAGYPWLARPQVRRWARWVMATPAGWLVGNDLFALAWRPEGPAPTFAGRFRPVH